MLLKTDIHVRRLSIHQTPRRICLRREERDALAAEAGLRSDAEQDQGERV